MNDIRHLVFDLGNVLIQWDPELPYRTIIPDAAERKRFLGEICNAHWLMQTDRGATWEEAEADLIARHPEDEALIRTFRPNWGRMIPGAIDESVGIVEGLIESGRDVTALSNWAADTFIEVGPRFPILQKFRGVTVSARVGLVKPDLAIYRHHEQAFGLDPARTIFFDDNAHNITAAREAGWHAEQFTSPQQLRDDLARYGIAAG